MKKIVAVVLLLSLLFALTACGKKDNKTAAENEAAQITFWHCMSGNAGLILDEQVKLFNETVGKKQNVQVTAIYQGAYTDATQKMNAVLGTGKNDRLPDVMQMDATGKVNYLSSGAAYTVDDAKKDDAAFDTTVLLPAALSNWQLNGVQLGVPYATSTTVMYYNKTMLQQKNAAVPETFGDIAALYPLFQNDGVSVYADLPNTPSLCNWLGQLGSLTVDNQNGNSGNATALACVDNGALVTFLTEWKNLYASGALENAAGSQERFAAGQIVFITASSSKAAGLRDVIGDRFEMGIAPFPRVNENAASGSTASGSCLVMFDTGNAQRKAAARLFVQYMTSAPVQAAIAAGTGYIPAHADAMEQDVYRQLLEQYPDYEVSFRQLTQTPGSMSSVTVGPSKDFYYAIQNHVSDMLTKNLTPEETAQALAAELNKLLAQYNRANP